MRIERTKNATRNMVFGTLLFMRAEKIISKAMHRLKRAPREIKIYKNRENIILDNMSRPAMPNRVNLDWYSECRDDGKENVGDYLGVPIFEYMTDYYGLDRNKNVGKTKHLYTVGSIIFFGYQNATIWGSGLLWKPRLAFYRDLDIRAVRGPMTRNTLLEMGGGTRFPRSMEILLYLCPWFISQRFQVSDRIMVL